MSCVSCQLCNTGCQSCNTCQACNASCYSCDICVTCNTCQICNTVQVCNKCYTCQVCNTTCYSGVAACTAWATKKQFYTETPGGEAGENTEHERLVHEINGKIEELGLVLGALLGRVRNGHRGQ